MQQHATTLGNLTDRGNVWPTGTRRYGIQITVDEATLSLTPSVMIQPTKHHASETESQPSLLYHHLPRTGTAPVNIWTEPFLITHRTASLSSCLTKRTAASGISILVREIPLSVMRLYTIGCIHAYHTDYPGLFGVPWR